MLAASVAQPAPVEVRPGITRRRLLGGWAYDLATLLIALLASSLVALAWMLGRTAWGRIDLGAVDAIIALALGISAGPAWTVWHWSRLWEAGTSGESALSPSGRGIWLASHPVSLPFWLWTTFICFATGVSVLAAAAVVLLTVTLVVGGLAAVSLVILLVRPGAWPLHLWIARASSGRRQ
jgi:hypothetical protein